MGHSQGAFEVARCYQHGMGCEVNHKEALVIYYFVTFQWEANSVEAIGKLADAFAKGIGVLKNYIFSYALSNFAAAAGYEPSIKTRDEIETIMTPEQIGKAQQLSCEWSNISDIEGCTLFPNWITDEPRIFEIRRRK